MNICLNEREFAENAIRSRSLGRKPSETLRRVAKYYAQVDGYKKQDLVDKLEEFLVLCDPDVVLVKWSEKIDSVVRVANNEPLVEVNAVVITKKEMDVVKTVKSSQARRLLLTMLAVAKYWNAVRPTNANWVNTCDSDLIKMANINTSSARQCKMIHDLRDSGYIRFSKRVDSLNTQVLFVDDNPEEVEMVITDFRSIGNQYKMHIGESFMTCEQCGVTVRRKSNAQRYCPECAAEIHIRQSVGRAMCKRGAQVCTANL